MADTSLKSPIEIYNELSAVHRGLTEQLFEKLLQQSGINADGNHATVKDYNTESAAAKSLKSDVSRKKLIRVFLIIGIVLACIAIVIGVVCCVNNNLTAGLLCIIAGAVFTVVAIIVIVKKLNPDIKATSAKAATHEQKAAALLAEAWKQVAPLNALFTDDITLNLIKNVMPEFEFDQRFTVENEKFMAENFGLAYAFGGGTSVTDTLSGRFNGNPFLFADTFNTYMGTHTYHGSISISWTETETDSQGNTHTVTKTETLHASVTKPEPKYYYHKNLYYGNQAAPDLSFSREPQHSERLSDKALGKKVKKGARKLEKKTQNATSYGNTFQSMSNTDFEVLFGATNRDHEVQFRLMYTPMAQRNTAQLLTSTTGYGDDFHFTKSRRLNIISSEHAQSWTMNTLPVHYYSYDADQIKNNFITFNTTYFKSLFFDFAPLMCVPVYMEKPTASAQPAEGYSGFSCYEHEVMANALGADKFANRLTATNVILKTALSERGSNYDVVKVTAYSYAAEGRVDFISVHGGDGHFHDVPVEWIEYIPVFNSAYIRITEDTHAQGTYGNSVYVHGMKGEIL